MFQNPFQCYAEIPAPAVMSGYQMKTTYWGDFRVCGAREKDIRDTYRRAVKYNFDNVEMTTELAMVLNWLIWYYHDNGDDKTARVYDELWRELDGKILQEWTGENKAYYLRTTD